MNIRLITIQIGGDRVQVATQPIHTQPDRLQGLSDSPFSARETVLLEELLHLLCLLFGRKVLGQVFDQAREQESSLETLKINQSSPTLNPLSPYRILIRQLLPVVLKVRPGHVPSTAVHRHSHHNENSVLCSNVALKWNKN